MRKRAILAAFTLALGACSAIGLPGTSKWACGAEPADTAGWPEITSRYGFFALRLPPGAHEVPLQCIDSACGSIQAGRWELHYDGGRLAGSGTSVGANDDETDVRICRVNVNGRRGHLLTARRAGAWRARLGVPLGKDQGGLYLYAQDVTRQDVSEFLAAARSLRILNAAP
ncbi:MAG TPA: hypothetical protein VJT67_10955 [Longimicrobiaceae bacterium]|nr:hypothetical protein [Longimicrobiaceae bacterium]